MWGFDALSSHLITHGQIQNCNFNVKKMSSLRLQLGVHVNTKRDASVWAPYLQRKATLYQREWKVEIGASFSNHLQTFTYQTLPWASGMMGDHSGVFNNRAACCKAINADVTTITQGCWRRAKKNPPLFLKEGNLFSLCQENQSNNRNKDGRSFHPFSNQRELCEKYQKRNDIILHNLMFSWSQLTPKSWVYSVYMLVIRDSWTFTFDSETTLFLKWRGKRCPGPWRHILNNFRWFQFSC